MDPQYLQNLKKGLKVTILTSQKKKSTGIIEEIAMRKQFNEEGIMVRLQNGDVGNVKEILLTAPEQNEKSLIEIKKFLKQGENFNTEFKAEALWSIIFSPQQLKETKSPEVREYGTRASKIIIAKSIAAFLNSDGGNLIIGIKENKQTNSFDLVGIEEDLKKIKDPSPDSYKRILIDEIIRAFFPSKIFHHLNDYLSFEFVSLENKTLCWIKIKKADSRVFLKVQDKEIFMIRVDSENRTLQGEKLVDYCIRKWGAR